MSRSMFGRFIHKMEPSAENGLDSPLYAVYDIGAPTGLQKTVSYKHFTCKNLSDIREKFLDITRGIVDIYRFVVKSPAHEKYGVYDALSVRDNYPSYFEDFARIPIIVVKRGGLNPYEYVDNTLVYDRSTCLVSSKSFVYELCEWELALKMFFIKFNTSFDENGFSLVEVIRTLDMETCE